MSQGTITLVAGALLAVSALAFVLYPLFFEVREVSRAPRGSVPSDDSAIVALREIEFDKATGKLSDADYAELKHSYSARALSELRARERAAGDEGSAVQDPIEARVREYREMHRACTTCGVRPEADAVYCSTCGAFLDRSGPRCAAPVTEPSSSFGPPCGMPRASAAAVSS